MHERELSRDLIAALNSEAAGRGLTRIRLARVAVGTIKDIDPEMLRLFFETTAADCAAAGAELRIEQRLAEAYCLNCGSHVVVRRRSDACPECGGFRLQLTSPPVFTVLDCDGD